MTPAEFALAHPVFDPIRHIINGHFFWIEPRRISGCLTVNIGAE